MNKRRVAIMGVIAVVLLAIVSSLFLLLRQPEESLAPESAPGNSEATNLGFTYLPVTPQVSAYYGLGVDSGALVTEVITDSPAARAGVAVGDVVLSFNGARVEETAPLLGMMMACPAEHEIVFEVWHGGSLRVVELTHVER